jgi:hypothetical protein
MEIDIWRQSMRKRIIFFSLLSMSRASTCGMRVRHGSAAGSAARPPHLVLGRDVVCDEVLEGRQHGHAARVGADEGALGVSQAQPYDARVPIVVVTEPNLRSARARARWCGRMRSRSAGPRRRTCRESDVSRSYCGRWEKRGTCFCAAVRLTIAFLSYCAPRRGTPVSAGRCEGGDSPPPFSSCRRAAAAPARGWLRTSTRVSEGGQVLPGAAHTRAPRVLLGGLERAGPEAARVTWRLAPRCFAAAATYDGEALLVPGGVWPRARGTGSVPARPSLPRLSSPGAPCDLGGMAGMGLLLLLLAAAELAMLLRGDAGRRG